MTAPQPKARWLWWRVAAVLTRSNLYSALATVALAYACCQLMGIASPKALFLLSAFCYVFAITTLNRLALGEGAGELATPRVAFYQRHAGALLAVSMLFAAGSIASLALARGRTPLILLLVAYAMGVAYSVRLVPQRWRRGLRIARLKDIPASKDVFIAIGWAVVCALIPWVGHGCGRPLGFAAAAAFALLLTFVKANLVDLRDMQEDRLLGRETLPILLGVRRTRLLMVGLALALAAALAAAAFPGWATPLAWLLTACPVCLLAQVAWVPHASDVGCTLIADGILLLAGALALAWHVLPLH
jgi:4-hydroxy-3-methylbut-2-enyl diphosphate reductase